MESWLPQLKMDELFIRGSFALYNAQGSIETYVDAPAITKPKANKNAPNFMYKQRCLPKDCPDCPDGSYCYTCSDCKVHQFDFTESNTKLKMLECKCKKNPKDNDPWPTVVNIDNIACSSDIANCDGKLKCGKCYNTSFYTFDGKLAV